MPPDAKGLGERIRELRGDVSRAQVARRAGIAAAYLHAVENATPSTRTGVPTIPSVPVIRGIADALDADRAELLELAGYEDDAAFDRAREARIARASGVPAALSGRLAELDPADLALVEQMVDRMLGGD